MSIPTEAATITVPAGLTTEGLLGKRYLARAIDTVVTILLLGILGALLEFAGPLVQLLAMVGVLCLYSGVLESSKWQASVGKKLMGLRVYGAHGGAISLGRACLRTVIKDGPFLIFLALPGTQVLNLVWLGVHLFVIHRSDLNQALHDKVVKTWVAAPEATTRLGLT